MLEMFIYASVGSILIPVVASISNYVYSNISNVVDAVSKSPVSEQYLTTGCAYDIMRFADANITSK